MYRGRVIKEKLNQETTIKAFQEIDNACHELSLDDDIKRHIRDLCRDLIEIKASYNYGYSFKKNDADLRLLCAATTYIVLRQHDRPIPTFVLGDAYNVGHKQVLKLSTQVRKGLKVNLKPITVERCLEYVIERMSPVFEVCKLAKSIAIETKTLTLSKSPWTLAGACLYTAALLLGRREDCTSEGGLTQVCIADVLNITEVSIRNIYLELINKLYDSELFMPFRNRDCVLDRVERYDNLQKHKLFKIKEKDGVSYIL